MDIETFIQFADENSLRFDHEYNTSLDTLKLMFTNPVTRRAYTYYVSRYEMSNVDKHDMVIARVKRLVTGNLLN